MSISIPEKKNKYEIKMGIIGKYFKHVKMGQM